MAETQEESDSTEYWKGKYQESATAREELNAIIKQLIETMQQQSKSSDGGGSSNALIGQLGAIIGAVPPLLMVLFGVYSTGTGADIGFPMIIVGAVFAAFVIPFLLTRRREAKKTSEGGGPVDATRQKKA